MLLKRETTLDGTSKHYLDTISSATMRMGQLIDDLLAFSRTGRTKATIRLVDSNEVVQAARTEMAATMKGRSISWLVGDLPAVWADRAMLQLVWENLIGNAVKYTRPA